MHKDLWFVAVMADEALSARVLELKNMMSEIYHAGHALKSPAHITIVPPFKATADELGAISSSLAGALKGRSPRVQKINGFGCFSPRVIFLKPENTQELESLFLDAGRALSAFSFIDMSRQHGFNPHMTLATRDLTPDNFKRAWASLSTREFSASFGIRSVTILKHVSSRWKSHRELFF